MKLNENYFKLKDSYLFHTIALKVEKRRKERPGEKIISLGIGDTTRPLCVAAADALRAAADEMSVKETYKGYGPYEGYDFLRESVADYYETFGANVDSGDVFISSGAKDDISNILDVFGADNVVAAPNPVYPVYVDTNVMLGRETTYIEGNEANGFTPTPSARLDADIIYICSPNNPTGAVYTKDKLKRWVDYANERGAVILFDAAYEAFIRDRSLPRSVYEIDGAERCAVELCSLSKTAGFTGVRCGWTVVPKTLERGGVKLKDLWLRRQSTKFNGVSYVIQRAAAAVLAEEGLRQTRADIDEYMKNGEIIAKVLREKGVKFFGGENSPYIWLKCGASSWDFFDMLLDKAGIVGTPGAGFGSAGEGYFRLTVFGSGEDALEAAERLKKVDFQ
ncbi:MAG: LL-diaminopimelate aminotransferase [Clostridiales bacterium]|jgi:LL-diaminopimelate aminotransferase|nr:LL-diaminopimelate aminotransferase [Clostridiales bacterium]